VQGTYQVPRTDNVAFSRSFNVAQRDTGGLAAAQWLRHYATSLKVADSRPDEVNEFFEFT
jgi:hypothetical protein